MTSIAFGATEQMMYRRPKSDEARADRARERLSKHSRGALLYSVLAILSHTVLAEVILDQYGFSKALAINPFVIPGILCTLAIYSGVLCYGDMLEWHAYGITDLSRAIWKRTLYWVALISRGRRDSRKIKRIARWLFRAFIWPGRIIAFVPLVVYLAGVAISAGDLIALLRFIFIS